MRAATLGEYAIIGVINNAASSKKPETFVRSLVYMNVDKQIGFDEVPFRKDALLFHIDMAHVIARYLAEHFPLYCFTVETFCVI